MEDSAAGFEISLDDILLLGDPRLRAVCTAVQYNDLEKLDPMIEKMSKLVRLFKAEYGKGRAIAAPQIGLMVNLIVLNIDTTIPIINPKLTFPSDEKMEIWDDCMSFPNLMVKLKRYKQCVLQYKDRDWNDQIWQLEDDMSELLQHECDHLHGILAVDHALDKNAFRWYKPHLNV